MQQINLYFSIYFFVVNDTVAHTFESIHLNWLLHWKTIITYKKNKTKLTEKLFTVQSFIVIDIVG